jgi:Na+-transporting NADH:ubiquinone oxidoreductase subunit NqrC
MSTPKGDGFVIGFAAVVCVVCSLLLSATASTLKSKQDFNVELDRKLNVLKAFGVDIKPGGVALPVTRRWKTTSRTSSARWCWTDPAVSLSTA